MQRASAMSTEAIETELAQLDKLWSSFRDGLEGMSGSPGEWMVERMDELETELRRRGAPVPSVNQ